MSKRENCVTEIWEQRSRSDDGRMWIPQDEYLDTLPQLKSFLTDCDVNGNPRERGKVALTADGWRLKFAVTEVTMEMTGYLTLAGLQTAWEELNDALGAGSIEWRRWNNRYQKNGKK